MAHQLAKLAEVEGQTFDYVIVGGGNAGSVLANRLSENPNVTVAVLEAGQARFDDALVQTVNLWPGQMGNPEYDWVFPVVPQEKAPNFAPYWYWHRAKSIGGSSCMNAMIYTKPGRDEMDALEALGNPGWNWETYQKYAKKSEKFHVPEAPVPDPNFRDIYNLDSVGHDGPLSISFLRTGSGADYAFQQSLTNNGVPFSPDALGGDIVGIFKGLSTIDPKTGKRCDAGSAYLLPALSRPNIKVLTGATVSRVITEQEGDVAVAKGVEFLYDGKKYSVSGKKDIILSTGTIKTPQILELSGIGDRKILEPLGIQTVVDLPGVGTNSQDHICCIGPIFRMKEGKGVISDSMLQDKAFAQSLKEKYNLEHDYHRTVNAFAFVPLQLISEHANVIIEKKRAQLEALKAAQPNTPHKLLDVQLQLLEKEGVDLEFWLSTQVLRPLPDPERAYVALPPNLTHPWSRGTVHITSTDPTANPKVDPGYFQDETDLDILAEGMKFSFKLANTEPFKELVETQVTPDPSLDLSTDENLKKWVSENIMTIWHTCGTAPMLPREENGVVNPKLQVYGTKNLRVVDLSVLPLQVSCHTQAIVYSLAEFAADIIKSDQ